MSKRIVMSIVLALLLIIAVTSSFLLFGSRFAPTEQPKVVHPPPYSVHRSEESPISSHRALSMVVNQVATELAPWGVALDYVHGFVWVAEPGCTPSPDKCASAVQGVLGQYALSDGTLIANYNEPDNYSSPFFVAVDGNGDVWFTQPSSDALGEFVPQDQSWQQWQLSQGSSPLDLTFDTHGTLWLTQFGTNALRFFRPATLTLVAH